MLPVGHFLHSQLALIRSRGIAWSKWGSIASITSNGAALELRNLRCSPEDGSWALSEPSITPPLVNMDGGPLKHLCWSPTGSELAVIDSAGRVTILAIFASLNKPSISRNCQVDPPDDLHKVVGCYWLNLGPYPANRLVCSYSKDENTFLTQSRPFYMGPESRMARTFDTKVHKLQFSDLTILTTRSLLSYVLQLMVY